MVHGAAELKHEFEALAHLQGTSRQITAVLAANFIVKRLNVAVRGVLQQDEPVALRGLSGPKHFTTFRRAQSFKRWTSYWEWLSDFSFVSSTITVSS